MDNFLDKFNEIFGNFFGENFSKIYGDGSEFANITKIYGDGSDEFANITPEDFMEGSEFSKTEETGKDENGNNFTKTTYVSKDGKRTFTRKVTNSVAGNAGSDSSKHNERLHTLKEELKRAVKDEHFERAAKLRDEITKIKNKC